MRNELLSVIIPVYNKYDYLESCVESVLNQTYENIEVILIDDGSIDGSDQICMRLSKDARVHVILQSNQGVVVARKNAAEKATGKYIVFIDADDYIESNYFEALLNIAEAADMVSTGYFRDGDTTSPIYDLFDAGFYHTREQLDHIIDNMIIWDFSFKRGITPYIWNKLFRKDLAEQVLKEVNAGIYIGEDSEFVYRYLLKCNSIRITDMCGYHYCNRNESVVNSRHDDYLINFNELYLTLKKLFENHRKKESLMCQLQIWMSIVLQNAPYAMNFHKLAVRVLRYIFPLYEDMKGKNIIIYGAGSVGKDYFLQLKNRVDIKVVGWTDSEAEMYQNEGYPLLPVDKIDTMKYDYIIISVYTENIFMEIKEELVNRGICEKKLVWKKPVLIQY